MKFTIERTKFLNAINTVKEVIGSNDLQILQNIKLEANGDGELLLTATNLDQTLFSKVGCQVTEPGGTTVPAKLIGQMVGALTTPMVEFKKDASSISKAVLSGGDVTYKIACIGSEEFPTAADVNGINIVFTQKELKDMLRKTVYAASTDSTRRVLMAICFQTDNGGVNAVGVDGRRLSRMRIAKDVKEGTEFIVPLASIKQLQRLLGTDGDVTVSVVSGKAAQFSTGNWTLQTKLVDDAFPAWEKVIPASLKSTTCIDKEALTDAVKQVSISSSALNNPSVLIAIKGGAMTLTASDADISDARATIPVKCANDDDFKGSINPKFILDVLGAFDSDEVAFNFNEGTSPITITAEGVDCVTVIMPLRVN